MVYRPWADASNPVFDEALAGMIASETVMEHVMRTASGGFEQTLFRLEPAR